MAETLGKSDPDEFVEGFRLVKLKGTSVSLATIELYAYCTIQKSPASGKILTAMIALATARVGWAGVWSN